MEEKQNILTKELQNFKKALLTEEVTGKNLHKYVDLEKLGTVIRREHGLTKRKKI